MARGRNEIYDAMEVFVRGFCFGKSQTHPYEYQRIGNVWVMRDAPRKNPRKYRKEEWVGHGVEPQTMDSLARRKARGRYFIGTVLDASASDQQIRMDFKRLRYRLLDTEALFVHRLKRIPRLKAAVKIDRVQSPETAQEFGQVTRSRPIAAQHLAPDAPFRQYIAIEDSAIVGWVRSVDAGHSTWCSNLYVLAAHRRRGHRFCAHDENAARRPHARCG